MNATLGTATRHIPERGKGLHLTLWIVQVLLALAFGMAGFMKLTTPLSELAQTMPWVPDVPGAMVRFIGASELAGALGLVLPALTRIRPGLTTLAAAGIGLIMILAALFHLWRGEFSALPVNAAFGGLAAFVAWGRSNKAPIPRKR
jgi:uncharacterized membrane protein YphA (DoxX/SURF4 family)